MRKGWYILLILLCTAYQGYSQQENIWAFGNTSGLDFNSGGPIAVSTGITGFGEANASVCDDSGQLLFYSTGVKIWDRNGNLMPNGNNLINDPGLAPLPPTAVDFTSSTSQGALIVPVPGSGRKYYLFSMTCAEMGINNAGMGRLYYSIVDMQLNGGLGDVVPGKKGILVDSGLTEHMAGVTGDRCNVWVLAISRLQNTLRAYSVTENGINANPVVSPLLPVNYFIPLGSIAASSDRKTLAIGRSGVGLYQFDPATGLAIGKVALAGPYSAASGAYNVCFSPDDSKLYVSYAPLILGIFASFQFDLSSGDSLTMVNSSASITNPISYAFKKASNGKIYTTSGGSALNVINFPNLPMPACMYLPAALPVTGTTGLGLPNTVPVFVSDTVTGHQEFKAGCFASGLELHAINDSTGWDYTWNTGATGAACTVDQPGTYWVTYKTAPCIYHTDTVVAHFPGGTLPQLHIEASCKGDTNGRAYVYTYAGDTTVYTYAWKNNNGTLLSATDSLYPAAAGNYTLQLHSANCDTTLAFTIPELAFSVSFIADSFYCQGALLSLQNTSENYFTDFLWDFGDGSTSAATSPAHTYTLPGTYAVVLSGSGPKCRDTARFMLTIDARAAALFTKDRDSICTGESITFYPALTPESITAYHWQSGTNFSLSALPDSVFRFAFDEAGTFPVSLTTAARACPDTSFTDSIYVYPLPLVDLGPDTVLCLNAAPILLRNAEQVSTDSRYAWSNGETSAAIQAKHPGTYRLTIRLAPLGCSNADEIVVNKGCYIDIPNAFTPNEDGTNDYFFPRQLLSRHVTQFRMQVFNRWGQVIFETDKTDGRGWDGRFNGSPQPGGVYLYLIDVGIDGHIKEQYQGNVTLLR